MRATRRPALVSAGAWLLLAAAAATPGAASAQTDAGRGWGVVPLLGFGVLRDNGSWGSAGLEIGAELEYAGTAWRGGGYASLRGLGVDCSHGCFTGGPEVAIGGSRSLGPLWIGGGTGIMRQFDEWIVMPFARISLDRTRFRVDLRLEVPQKEGLGIYLPLLVGFPVSE